jgi:hypothetical protein
MFVILCSYFTVQAGLKLFVRAEYSRCSDGLRAEQPGVLIPSISKEIFLCSTAFRPTLGPTQLRFQWELRADFVGVNWMWCEADRSPPSSAEVKNSGAVPPLIHAFSWRGA